MRKIVSPLHLALSSDVQFANKFTALNIPAVSFATEVHTILHRGRRANMAIARFTQEKGAKSSFMRVVLGLETALRERGLLIEDQAQVEEIRKWVGL